MPEENWLRDLLVGAIQEAVERVFERMPDTKPRPATVTDVTDDVITVHLDGDPPETHIKPTCITKVPVAGDRVFVSCFPGGTAFVVGPHGGFA